MDKDISVSSVGLQEYPLIKEFITDIFNQHVAPSYSKKGCQEFYKVVSIEHLTQAAQQGALIRAFTVSGEMAGIIHLRENHIVLLFVHNDFHGQGVGKFIIDWAKSIAKQSAGHKTITVNSSPNSIRFYQKQGFTATGDEQNVDGVRFTPMKIEV